MTDPRSTIPFDQLPPSFARTLESPPTDPAPALPAATLVLLRRASASAARPALEVLLLRRVRTAGFVPGAFVFPGGRVDAHDGAADVLARVDGIQAYEAARRLGLASDASPSALSYYVAAVREAFEETGLLVGRDHDGRAVRAAPGVPSFRAALQTLRGDAGSFASVLDRLGAHIDGSALEYVAHWITPVAEPRRYDTRFFAAEVNGADRMLLHAAELSEAVWLTPAEALELNVRGDLPMVFPTIRTLESLLPFGSPAEALAELRGKPVPTILPRLVTTPRGVAMEL